MLWLNKEKILVHCLVEKPAIFETSQLTFDFNSHT